MERSGGTLVSDVKHWFTAPHNRGQLRITQVRALELCTQGDLKAKGGGLDKNLKFDRLTPFVLENADDLPRIICKRQLANVTLRGERLQTQQPAAVRASAIRELLVDIPGGDLLVVRTVDVDLDVLEVSSRVVVVALMEDLYYESLSYDSPDSDTSHWVHAALTAIASELVPDVPAPESVLDQTQSYHQLVFIPKTDNAAKMDFQTQQKIIYRAEMTAVPAYCEIVRPSELNRREDRGAALGPFVSVLWGQQDYIENCALVSSMLLVAGSSTATQVSKAAYRQVRVLSTEVRGEDSNYLSSADERKSLRADLEEHRDESRRLDIRLAFGVEARASIQSMIPSLRVDSYHQSLFQALGLAESAQIARRLLDRSERSVAAAAENLASYEEALSLSRQRRWGIAIGLLTAVVAPISILLAFFGVNSPDVDSDQSIFNLGRYLAVYLAVLFLIVVPMAVYFVLRARDLRSLSEARTERRARSQRRAE